MNCTFFRSFLSMAVITSLGITCTTEAKPKTKQHSFKKLQLTDQFWCEGANIGDFNKDGKMDVVSGPFWYEAPDFKKRHEYYPAEEKFKKQKPDGTVEEIPGFEGALGRNNTYSKNFVAYSYDFNKDKWPDILILGFPGEQSWWFENPRGKEGGHWPRHVAIDVTDNESPTFDDLTGDGKPEIICSSKGFMGYAEPDWQNPTNHFKWHNISPDKKYHRFTHGLGYGDVNGDGRKDVLEKDGWYEQPASLEGDPLWTFHAFPFAKAGGAQMHVYDVNGDGLNDVITSLAAHAYGLAWYEQLPKTEQSSEVQFKQHLILNPDPTPNSHGISFSQLHAVDLVDMNGDGLKDILTGKRFWAHGSQGDPEPNAPAVLYWFELNRTALKSAESAKKSFEVTFDPHLIDDDSGIGTQVLAADVNKDRLLDVVVGNKKGTFVHIHEVKKAGPNN